MLIRETINNAKNRIQKSSFLKSVITLASGTVIGQGINTIGMPVISRLYSPAAMGDYALVTANANVIGAAACLGMMTAVMLPQDDEEAGLLVRMISVSAVTITTAAVIILKCIEQHWMFFHPEKASYTSGLAILWAYVISNTISSACYGYANRKRLYQVMFWNPVISGAANIVLGILFGVMTMECEGYALAHIISSLINILHLAVYAKPYRKTGRKHAGFWKLLKEYRRFPLYQMPANLISNLSNQLPLQMMEMVYSSYTTGMYSMALRVLSIPTAFLAVPVNRVYYQEANQRYQEGKSIGDFSFQIIKTNIKAAMLPIGVIILLGRTLFAFFLGSQWEEAGSFASVMGIYQLMLFCSNCLSGNFVIIGKNSWNLISSIAIVAIEIFLGFILLLKPDMPLQIFLMILCMALTLHLIVVLGVFLVTAGVRMLEYIRFVLLYIGCPCLVMCILNYKR